MPKSDRDPAQLAREREARLAARFAKAFLKSGAAEKAVEHLSKAIDDPKCPKRTRVSAAKSLLANAAKVVGKDYRVDVNAQVANLTMADLVALSAASPSGDGGPTALPSESSGIRADGSEGVEDLTGANGVEQRSIPPLSDGATDQAAESSESPEATDEPLPSSPLRSSTDTPADTAPDQRVQPDATEGPSSASSASGDPTRYGD